MSTMTAPFAATEFVEQVAVNVPFRVLGLAAKAIEDAAIALNNEGIMLPEDEWRALRDQCDLLTQLSDAYAKAAVGRLELSAHPTATH